MNANTCLESESNDEAGEREHAVPPTGVGGEGQHEQFVPRPQCKGTPKQCRTCSNKMGSSVTFFFKGVVLLYFRLKSAFSFGLRFMLMTQIMHNYLTWLLRSPLAKAPYVVLFDLKPLIEDGNLQVYMYCVHA